MNLSLAVLAPFLGAVLAGWLSRRGANHAAWTAAGTALLALGLLAPLLPRPFADETTLERVSWIPSAGLDLCFRLDGFGMLFALMILGIGLLIVLYARYYFSPRDPLGRFYAELLLFMGSMLGLVLSENVIQLLIFWELTSLSSFLLVGYWPERKEARLGARMALTVTGAGGLALLGGFLLLGEMAGSYELTRILAAGDVIRAHPLYLPALTLVLLGAFTKSAQFPFHFWLPNAMAAPTPVSAYLHSATMVKAGVFLLARLFPALSGTPEWTVLVGGAGLATLLVGAAIALFKHDLKGLLAYSTISHLGLIAMLLGIGTPLAALAAVFHIVNHATFKASLFMAAGIIDHETGTRDMRRINGLWRYIPHTATLAMVAAAAMAGVPLFNGFLSKELFFSEAVSVAARADLGWLVPLAVTVAGVFAVAYSLRFIHDVFFNGEPVDLPRAPHEPPRWMKVPVEVLAILCLAVGMFPALTVEPLLTVAVQGVLQGPVPVHNLAIWHGLSPALFMSLTALAGGGALYLVRKPLFRLHDRIEDRFSARIVYDLLVDGLFGAARVLTRAQERASLQAMLTLLVLSAVVLGLAGRGLDIPALPRLDLAALPLDPFGVLSAASMAVAAVVATLLHRQRLTAVLLIGAVGLAVALAFAQLSAPDLALTQLAVELVTVVLLLLALYFLPQASPAEPGRLRHVRDLTLSGLTGLGMAALAWSVMTEQTSSIGDYFLAQSVPGGGGSNVVNVILVDFRGFDTLGEISVLAVTALGVYSMLESLTLAAPTRDWTGRPWSSDLHPLVLAAFARILLPIALLVAAFLFLRGHNQPGGGFVAGLVTAVALILQYLANGAAWSQARPPTDPQPAIGLGLLVAGLTGLGSLALGYPYLTSAHGHLHVPLIGDLELASAMLFDLGVYLTVVGSTLLILIRLGLVHQQSHEPAARPIQGA